MCLLWVSDVHDIPIAIALSFVGSGNHDFDFGTAKDPLNLLLALKTAPRISASLYPDSRHKVCGFFDVSRVVECYNTFIVALAMASEQHYRHQYFSSTGQLVSVRCGRKMWC